MDTHYESSPLLLNLIKNNFYSKDINDETRLNFLFNFIL